MTHSRIFHSLGIFIFRADAPIMAHFWEIVVTEDMMSLGYHYCFSLACWILHLVLCSIFSVFFWLVIVMVLLFCAYIWWLAPHTLTYSKGNACLKHKSLLVLVPWKGLFLSCILWTLWNTNHFILNLFDMFDIKLCLKIVWNLRVLSSLEFWVKVWDVWDSKFLKLSEISALF